MRTVGGQSDREAERLTGRCSREDDLDTVRGLGCVVVTTSYRGEERERANGIPAKPVENDGAICGRSSGAFASFRDERECE